MNIGYLNEANSNVFEVICRCLPNKTISLEYILLTPIIRFIDNEEFTKFILEELDTYSKNINSLDIKIKNSEELICDSEYFLTGIDSLESGEFAVKYSESFLISKEDLEKLREYNIQLAKVLTSTIEFDSENIKKLIETELTDALRLNYHPIDNGVTDIIGVTLKKSEIDNYYLSMKSYMGEINNTLIDKFFNLSLYIIESKIKNFNLFLVNEDTVIIKLGLSTSGEYIIDINEALLYQFNEEELKEIKDNLISIFEEI